MRDPHNPIGGQRIGRETCQQFQDLGQIGPQAVVIELPGGKPRPVADGGTEELAPAAQPVDRLRRAEPKELLDFRCGQCALDEVPHDGGAALIVQRLGGNVFERSLWHRWRLQNGVENRGEAGVALCPSLDLASERSNGCGHDYESTTTPAN